jgi:hypothetical protein
LTKLGSTLFRARYRTNVGDSNAANKVPVIVQAAASQTANLIEVYDSSKNLLTAVDPNGNMLATNVSQASVTVSSAEILALFTTAKTLLAAPGANKVYELVSATLTYVYNTTAYTVGSSTNLAINYKDKTGAAVTTTRATTGFIDQTANSYSLFRPLTAQLALDANAINQPLCLSLAGANPTLGDGTFKLNLIYRVHTLV